MQNYQNMYQSARMGAGYTQEAAAAHLGLDPKSIQDYEAGKRSPKVETVRAMSILYRAPWLANQFCNQCPLRQFHKLPEKAPDIQNIAIRAELALRNKEQLLDDAHMLLEFACDGELDQLEASQCLPIVDRLWAIGVIAEEIRMLVVLNRYRTN